jgi:serine/threonine protein kinase
VSGVLTSSLSSSVSIRWVEPEFSSSLIGYVLRLFQGYSAADTMRRETPAETLIVMLTIPFTQRSIDLNCTHLLQVPCLIPFTNYRVEISALREEGIDLPLSIFVSTREVVPEDVPLLELTDIHYRTVNVCVSGLSTKFGLITMLEFQLSVISTMNDAVIPRDTSQSFKLPTPSSTCVPFVLEGLIPQTTYSIVVRAATVAGFGPFSNLSTARTMSLHVQPMFPPSIALLSQNALNAHGWKDGFSISWRLPQDLDSLDFIRFDVMDSGRTSNMSIIYSGALTTLDVEFIYGEVSVRAVTIGGIGEYSEAVDASSLKPKPASTDLIPIVVPVVLVVILAFILTFVVGTRYYRRYKLHQERIADIKRRIPPAVVAVLERINDGKFNVPRDISPLDLTFLDTLGEGKFGAVMKAMLDEQHKTGVPGYLVAVKMAKEDAPPDQIEEMKLEAAIMAQFTHPNVVGLIGQVHEGDLFLIVVPFCEHGSLLSWLIEFAKKSGTLTMLNMCVDAAAGMAYLETLGIVHRDLAARNVLVSSDLSCKVSDFGLSRATDSDGAAKTGAKDQVAIRWAAPEAIAERKYTCKSDVWSYGILLHEVFTFGTKPYDGWTNKRVLEELRKGFRLPKPLVCSVPIYDIMMRTWHADPNERPSFAEIYEEIRRIALNTQGTERDGSISTNKLVEKFNAKKREIMNSSAEEDYKGESSTRKSRSHLAEDPYRSQGSVYTRTGSQKRSNAPSHSQSARADSVSHKKIDSSKTTGRSALPRLFSMSSKDNKRELSASASRKTHFGGNKQASYIALIGSGGKIFSAQTEIPNVPPVYKGIVEKVSKELQPIVADDTIEVQITARASGEIFVQVVAPDGNGMHTDSSDHIKREGKPVDMSSQAINESSAEILGTPLLSPRISSARGSSWMSDGDPSQRAARSRASSAAIDPRKLSVDLPTSFKGYSLRDQVKMVQRASKISATFDSDAFDEIHEENQQDLAQTADSRTSEPQAPSGTIRASRIFASSLSEPRKYSVMSFRASVADSGEIQLIHFEDKEGLLVSAVVEF